MRAALLSALLWLPLAAAQTAEPLSNARARFMGYGIMPKEVGEVFHSRTIQRGMLFTIDVPAPIFVNLFGDLGYAVKQANLIARKPYSISNRGAYWAAWDGDKTWASIWPLYSAGSNGHFCYFIRGTYKGGITVNGSMAMEVKFTSQQGNTFFFINTWISIDDPFMRELAQFLRNFKSFSDYLNRLIDGTIGEIRRVGFITARGLHKTQAEEAPRREAPP